MYVVCHNENETTTSCGACADILMPFSYESPIQTSAIPLLDGIFIRDASAVII